MRRPAAARRRTAALAATVGLTLAAAACGGDTEEQDPAPAVRTAANGDVYNDADVAFATEMIPHHAEAVQMVVLAADRPLDPEVELLAQQIREAQVPEVEQMTDWLTAWGEDVPETSLDHANAHDLDHMEGTEELEAASDEDFQDTWLRLMIEHHEGAVSMAEQQLEDGEFGPAIDLARSIERSQQAEIATMEGLLGG